MSGFYQLNKDTIFNTCQYTNVHIIMKQINTYDEYLIVNVLSNLQTIIRFTVIATGNLKSKPTPLEKVFLF